MKDTFHELVGWGWIGGFYDISALYILFKAESIPESKYKY